MPLRPFTRRQALQNAAFLDALRRTGNARLAARELGVNRSTFTKRRAKSAAFAAEWESALLAAHAAFKLAGGPRPPEGTVTFTGGGWGSSAPAPESDCPPYRTRGGELYVTRASKTGRLQLRRAPPGRMTKAAEQVFFRALAASANVRLSAALTGFAHASFYYRKRVSAPFAREMRVAITIGHDRLHSEALGAAIQAMEGGGGPDSAWRDCELSSLPPMTVSQCIQLLYLHENRDRLRDRPDRLAAAGPTAEQVRAGIMRKLDAIERAAHYEETGDWRRPGEAPPPALPPLERVTGWSKANPDRAQAVHNPNLALFGGWRITDWKRRRAKG